ncbi:MAG: hypothetical protein ACTSXL_05395 [Alphaproteobacteria bacterium]
MGAGAVGGFVDKTIGAGIDIVQEHKQKKQKEAEINAQVDSKRKQYQLNKEEELVKKNQYEVDQTNLLKRALATQKARYGAGGVGIKSNSAKSVLGRMKSDKNRNTNDYSDLSNLRLKQLKNNMDTAETNALLAKKRASTDHLFGVIRAGHEVVGAGISASQKKG